MPGSPVGAGGAFTGGEKLLAPPGVRLFSVGVTDGAVVVVVVLLGAGVSLLLEQAVSAPIVMIAPPPMTNATRRVKRSVFMFYPNPIPELRSDDRLRGRRRLDADVNIMPRVEQIACKTPSRCRPVLITGSADGVPLRWGRRQTGVCGWQRRAASSSSRGCVAGSRSGAREVDDVVEPVEQRGGHQVV